MSSREKRAARKSFAHAAVDAAADLEPDGIVVCATKVLDVLRPLLLDAGLSLLHEESIDFPMPWARDGFADELSRLAASLAPPGGWTSPSR